MPVSLFKATIPASRAAGHWVHLFPGGNPVLVTSVRPLPARSVNAPRVRLYGTLGHGGSVQTTYPSGAGLQTAQAI